MEVYCIFKMGKLPLLPSSEVYEKEFEYFPWAILTRRISEVLIEKIPKKSKVLDLMCGPGYLLGKLKEKRPDLNLTGVDISEDFIDHSKSKYSEIEFIQGDVLDWESPEKFDVIICTAGIHHLPYEKQESFVRKIKSLLAKRGFVLTADPFIGNFKNEMERKLEAAKLGYEYLKFAIKKNAPADIIQVAVGLIGNDVLMDEFKTSKNKLADIFVKHFREIKLEKTWPEYETDFGEYFFILK